MKFKKYQKNKVTFFLSLLVVLCGLLTLLSCRPKIDGKALEAWRLASGDYYQADYKKAEQKALELWKDKRNFYQAGLLYAKALYMQEKYDICLPVLEKLCSRYRIYPEAEKWYIRTLLQTGQNEKAISEIEMVLSFDPENIDIISIAATAYAAGDNLQKQLTFLNQILAHTEKIARSHLELAKIYYSFLEYEKALQEVNNALALLTYRGAPAEKESLLAEAVRKLGKIIKSKKEYSR